MAFNQTGATSLAYFRGDKTLEQNRKKKFKRVNFADLTAEQERKAAEQARNTGLTFHECAEKVINKQKNLEEYQNGA